MNILNITLENILIIINKILKDLNFKVGLSDKINNVEELIYYNNNNYIKINNNNEIVSSLNKINIDISKYIKKRTIEDDFLRYILLFNTYYDLDLKTLDVLYKDDSKVITDSIKYVNNLNDEWTIILNKNEEIVYDFNRLKLQNKIYNLFYKKSKNYDSYNYLKKFYKNVMTFNQEKQITLLNCNWSDYSNEKLKNYLFNNEFKLEFDYNNIDINLLLYNIPKEDKEYCKNILYNSERKTELNVNIYLNTLQIDIKNYNSFIELENIKSTINEFINFVNLENDIILKMNENLYYDINDKVYNIYNNIYNLYNYQDNININEYYIYIYLKKLEEEKIENQQHKTAKQIKVSTNIKLVDSDDDETDDSISSISMEKDDSESDDEYTIEELEKVFKDTNKEESRYIFDGEIYIWHDGELWEESPHERIGARDGTIYSSEFEYIRPIKKKKNILIRSRIIVR